ncbi:stalk domain-containing protein [Paenibacillus sp. KN14-4R]|uniref:stalk domain-containing protein n=1 Tax=Paenibacillus sp. KN14-4R TaxID=3445773 RepID=UPI003F9EE7AE
MKKFILGFVCGGLLLGSVGAYASDKIEAYLFPVDYGFNAELRQLNSEYETFNYKGHAYVPVRFIAENLGAYVNYDDSKKRINIGYYPPNTVFLKDDHFPTIHAGIINLAVDGGHTLIKAAVSVDSTDENNIYDLQFNIKFYDSNKKMIGEYSWTSDTPLKKGEIRYIMDSFPGNATGYEKAILEVTKHVEKPGNSTKK